MVAIAKAARTFLRVRSPSHSAAHWHTSLPVDLAAYAFSWIWVFIPLVFVGDSHRIDYPWVYLLIIAATEVHRHYGLPYVYLDRQVFGQHPLRFTLFPMLMLGLWAASPFFATSERSVGLPGLAGVASALVAFFWLLRKDRNGARPQWLHWATAALAITFITLGASTLERIGMLRAVSIRSTALLNGIAVLAGVWNIWHVYSQKYGILRMYNAKSGQPAKIPSWVDRFLIWGWFPLYLFYLGPRYGDYALERFSRGRTLLAPAFEWLSTWQTWFLVPTVSVVVASIGLFLCYEWRIHRLTNAPRLWMAAGTTLLASTFLFVHPLKAYVAYAFSHAVEYMVFVWAFQRRRYSVALEHKPLLAHLTRQPLLYYLGLWIALGAAFIVLKYGGRWFWIDMGRPRAFGFTTKMWLMYWTVYQSMVHFYYDGFLWKMRLPAVRANL